MNLKKMTINGAILKSVPRDELIFCILVQILLTEVQILQKLLIACQSDDSNVVLEKAQNAQRMFLIRMLARKLFEGWKLTQKKFFRSQLSRDYKPILNQRGADCLRELRQYFKRPNSIKSIRNKFAFHFPDSSDVLACQIQRLDDSEQLELYIAPEGGNCLYDLSNAVYGLALCEVVNFSDIKSAVTTAFADSIKVAKWFIGFGHAVIEVFLKRIMKDSTFEDVPIPDPPDLTMLRLPYFVSRSNGT